MRAVRECCCICDVYRLTMLWFYSLVHAGAAGAELQYAAAGKSRAEPCGRVGGGGSGNSSAPSVPVTAGK